MDREERTEGGEGGRSEGEGYFCYWASNLKLCVCCASMITEQDP